MNDVQPSAGDAAPLHSRRCISRQVSVINSAEDLIITYRWAHPRALVFYLLPVLAVGLLNAYIFYDLGVNVSSVAENFNVIDYAAVVIGVLSVSYFAAMLIFNKTTTEITDTTISVQRGPFPCPWPGDHVRAIDEVREVSYVPHATVNPYGFVTYTVFVTFKDGEAARLFFLTFKRGDDEAPAVELANQVQACIDEKKQRRRTALRGSQPSRASEMSESPISRRQRRKVVACLLTTFLTLTTLVVAAEHFAAQYRLARHRAREAVRTFH